MRKVNAPRAPWQNGYVERLIGSVRRECTDHLIVFSEEHLRQILAKYSTYYNEVRVHISLGKDAPCTRPIERFGGIVAHPKLMRVLTDRGSEYCGNPERHEYELYLAVEDVAPHARDRLFGLVL